MADESMLALPGLSPLQYTLTFYIRYMDMVKELVKKLNKGEQISLKIMFKKAFLFYSISYFL